MVSLRLSIQVMQFDTQTNQKLDVKQGLDNSILGDEEPANRGILSISFQLFNSKISALSKDAYAAME